jgi:spore coat protein CotF
MPELTPSEFMQMHELALSYATAIEKASAYLSFVRDRDLESMLRHARQKLESHYEELLEISSGESLDRQFKQMDGGLSPRARGQARQIHPVQPEPQQGLSDRTIATDCLIDAKGFAVKTIWAATEISHVGLRRALSEMSRYHLDAAYEFYRFMEQQGWYIPLKPRESAQSWFRETHKPLEGERTAAVLS